MILSPVYVLKIVFLCPIPQIRFIKAGGRFVLGQFCFLLDVSVKKMYFSETSTLRLQLSWTPPVPMCHFLPLKILFLPTGLHCPLSYQAILNASIPIHYFFIVPLRIGKAVIWFSSVTNVLQDEYLYICSVYFIKKS